SLLIQGLSNDIYSLIDSNNSAKELWDALRRHMLGSEYDEQDKKVAVLYEYETFKATEEMLLDTLHSILTIQSESEGTDDEDISDLKKINAMLAKAFNRKKYYFKPTNNNLRTSSANKKPEYMKSEEKKEDKKVDEKKRDMSKVKCDNCKKKGHFTKDCKKAKVKDYNYYKTKMLLPKKDKESSSSSEETIADVSYYTSDSESESEYKTSEYYDNSTNYGLFVDNDDDQENFHDAIQSASENFNENHITIHMIMPYKDKLYNGQKGIGFENPGYFCKAKELRPSLYDERVIGLGYTLMFLTHSNDALEIEKFKRARENKIEFAYDYKNLDASYVNEKINFLDDYFQDIINPDFDKIDSSFQQTSSLKPYVPTMILEKIIINLEDDVERRNRTLIEAARTLLTFANLPLFIWAEAIATACFTQNRSIIHKRFDKTPHELINKRKPNIKFFHVFGCRCYLLNDYDDVGKLKEKGDIEVFVGYSKESAAYRVYNKCIRKIHESVNVNFDEISEMASKQFSLEPNLSNLNETRKSSNPTISQVSEISKKNLEDLFYNFYDEYFDSSKITKSLTTNVETSNNKIRSHKGEIFHEISESF
nr:retrovirus-related Pol polyprotein from transposon TNT 1-94 [Tanacetum cinerariifolium]